MRALMLSLIMALAVGTGSQAVPHTPDSAAFKPTCRASSLQAELPAIVIDRTEVIPAGPTAQSTPPAAFGFSPSGDLPEHCLIRGSFEHRTGADGRHYAIGFELRIPANWNGRLLFQGGGAFKGTIDPAVGTSISRGTTAPFALVRGYAVVTSDSGHRGNDAAFTKDQQARINYAYDSIGKVTRAAKSVVDVAIGQAPVRTYFAGCSNGGREAMMAAQRFPNEFDGVLVGNPAHAFSRDQLLKWHSINSYSKIAPKSASGTPQPWLALNGRDWETLSSAVVAQCDAKDGLKDGLIMNQSACQFSPATLICRPGQTERCLSSAKAKAVSAAFAGPRSATGNMLTTGWTYDASVGMSEWLGGQAGYVDDKGNVHGKDNWYPNVVLTDLFRYPPVKPEVVMTEGPEATIIAMKEMEGMINATGTDLSTFAARGGKMMLVHGWSDPVLAPMSMLRWYEQLQGDSAATGRQASDFARAFMIPGMTHCGGGRSLDDFDALEVLVDWVEKDRAPDSFLARGKSFPGVSRPICAWPKAAYYNGKGDPAAAENFTCGR